MNSGSQGNGKSPLLEPSSYSATPVTNFTDFQHTLKDYIVNKSAQRKDPPLQERNEKTADSFKSFTTPILCYVKNLECFVPLVVVGRPYARTSQRTLSITLS